ncbi:MAG: thiamine pyrophosphate-dependent enzyme [Bdellovibrionaceae bacterium]|nr:thiamine pyrophosphate-dependent enzyme [Pseudobdellovibrionaceae bacterium]MDW8189920.1 1-deoxy-D-xylulose-5-phosphate synthase N-terminal domain-containing protein [Pseudobdellovibrionaceae bacterium]
MEQQSKKNVLPPKREDLFQELVTFHKKRKLPHLGSVASCFDILYDLFFFRLTPQDYFILSKGHATSLLYLLLKYHGVISEAEWDRACRNGSPLAAHPPFAEKMYDNWMPFGSGSLGCGLGLAAGVALGCLLQKKDPPSQVFVLVSDGDLNAGTSWEALHLIAQLKLYSITILYDSNEYQATTHSTEFINHSSLKSYLSTLGYHLWEGDGHIPSDPPWYQIQTINQVTQPKFFIFHTKKNFRLNPTMHPLATHYYDGS